jgi:hypothetical protein
MQRASIYNNSKFKISTEDLALSRSCECARVALLWRESLALHGLKLNSIQPLTKYRTKNVSLPVTGFQRIRDSEKCPNQGESHTFMDYSQHENVEYTIAKLPVRTVYRQYPRLRNLHESGHKSSDLAVVQLKLTEEAVQSFFARFCFGSPHKTLS